MTYKAVRKLFKYAACNVFGIDIRALAVIRVSVALLILIDLFIRAQALTAHYTDMGVLPRALLDIANLQYSLHALSGSIAWQIVLFIIATVYACFLLVGYQTKFATFVSWFLLFSLQLRNPYITQGGDTVLRMALFIGMFLPWNRIFSVDVALGKVAPYKKRLVLSAASAAFILQIVFIYVFTAIEKIHPRWLMDGLAVSHALMLDQMTSQFGQFLLHFPTLLVILSISIFYLEFLGPIFLFVPYRTDLFRMTLIPLFLLLHIGIAIFMEIGLFPYISLVVLFAFLPPPLWDRLEHIYKRLSRRVHVYYDATCGFCKTSVALLSTFFFVSPPAHFVRAQSNVTMAHTMNAHNSWVIVDETRRTHFGFDGALILMHASVILRPLSYLFSNRYAKLLGERLYRWIAFHRKQVCSPDPFRQKHNRIPPMPQALASTFIIAAILFIFLWNLNNVGVHILIPKQITDVASSFGLTQQWNLFAPYPGTKDGWYIISATRADGKTVDIFQNGAPVTYKKPKLISAMYPNHRWRKFHVNISIDSYATYRAPYAAYLCYSWNKNHPPTEHIRDLELIFMREETLLTSEATPYPDVLLEYTCDVGYPQYM